MIVGIQGNIEMSSVHSNEEPPEIEESQVTTLTMLGSQDPTSDSVDTNELKFNQLQQALSISPSQSIDYMEMSGATSKKMGKAKRNLLERSATSLSNNSSVGGTPKRAMYNPYSYSTYTGHQKDTDIDQKTESTATNLNQAQQEFMKSSCCEIQKRCSTGSNNSVSVGNGGMAVEMCNGQDDVSSLLTVKAPGSAMFEDSEYQ